MTRRDYVMIAEAIKYAPIREIHGREMIAANAMRREIVMALSHALQGDNPRFDPIRFQSACGLFDAPTSIRDLTTMERYELNESA